MTMQRRPNRAAARTMVASVATAFTLAPGGAAAARSADAVTVTDVAASRAPAFAVQDLRVPVGGAVLAARLLLPAGPPPHAAAVLLPGARSSSNLPGLAEHLAGNGIAALELEKRGMRGSTGTWKRETFQQRADDALAAVELLKRRGDIDPARIGLVGHSQGGYIAPLAAVRSDDVAYVVMLAGPGQTVRDQVLTYERILLERTGVTPAEVQMRVRRLGRQLSAAARLGPLCRGLSLHYVCNMIDYDPAPALEALRVPVLALFAELDPMVPPEPNVELVRHAAERGGHRDATLHVFPAADHGFAVSETGIEHRHAADGWTYVPGFLETVHTWILERVRQAAVPGSDVHRVDAAGPTVSVPPPPGRPPGHPVRPPTSKPR